MQKKKGLLQRNYIQNMLIRLMNGEYYKFNNKGRHAHEKYKRNRGFFYKSE